MMLRRLGPPDQSCPSGEDVARDMCDVYDHGLYLDDAPSKLEKIHDYEPGGHHPAPLSDHLGEADRHRIIHKLGNGGCANIWLGRDTAAVGSSTRCLALKILVADVSEPDCPALLVKGVRDLNAGQDAGTGADHHICFPLDKFTIDGPNGSHLCVVYAVLGPRVSLGILHESGNRDRVLREAARQAVQALSFLHENGICHSGFYSR